MVVAIHDEDTGKVFGETRMNWPEVIRFTGIGLLLILALALLVLPVHAAPYLNQGDTVCLEQIVDISGVLGGYASTAYYGLSGDTESDPSYVYELPDSKKGWYSFYIDPNIFGKRLGPWYKFVGNNTGVEHGNLLAFYVKSKEACQLQNVTLVATPAPTITPITQIVSPKRFDTDYQIAYGDALSITVNNKTMPSRLWVFGRVDSVYNKSFPTSVVSLSKTEVQNLEAGSYTVIVQNPGKNAVFEVGYSKIVGDTKTVEELVGTPCTINGCTINRVDIFGLQPRMAMIKLRELLKPTDDVLTEYRIEVASPVIDIISIDETYSGGKDVLDIRGYTNVAKGTPIAFVFDEEKQTERTLRANTYMTSVQETTPNQWRYFQVFVPIDYNEIAVGQHEITATTIQGAHQTVPFYVYDIPKGQEVPNETVRYVAGNLWVPTPTPERIVETIKVIETQTIYVPVTPNDEQVYIAQKRASDTNWKYWLTTIGVLGLVGVLVSAGSWYMWGVVKRARRKK